MCRARVGHFQSDLDHDLLEERAILAPLDRLGIGTDKTHTILLKNSAIDELHGGIEGGLSTEGREECIGFLALDDLLDDLRGDRLDVGPVGKFRIGHDRGRIGIHQHHFVSLLSKGLAGLDTGIVKLAPLTDDNGACTDQQDFTDGSVFRHGSGKYRKRWRCSTATGEY